MPTARPRHSITETDAVAAAIDDAARVWPELRDDRAALLRRLIEEGSAATANPRSRVREAAGAATGTYPRDAASALKAEWPE